MEEHFLISKFMSHYSPWIQRKYSSVLVLATNQEYHKAKKKLEQRIKYSKLFHKPRQKWKK